MSNPFIAKLKQGCELTASDVARLERIVIETRAVPARRNIIAQGDKPESISLLVQGWACRYKTIGSGRRSIMAFLLPGDFCDLHIPILGHMDHSVSTLTRCVVARISHDEIEHLTQEHPRITRALWWSTLVDIAILREWLANMGHRSAERQIAHLFCELRRRLLAAGQAAESWFHLPLTQEELADALGISAVHVNRVLQHLRDQHLIVLEDRLLTIPNIERLEKFADFVPDYLHQQERQGAL